MNDRTDERHNARDAGLDDGIDFGEDMEAGAPDPAFDAWVARVAPTLNAPPGPAPRLEMWHAIESARRASDDAQAGRVPGVTPLRRAPWRMMSIVAAALLLGVAIDRMVLREASTPGGRVASAPADEPSDSDSPSRVYRLAASQTLTQAEALLTAFRASNGAARDPEESRMLGQWGREVLRSSRLLLDSPAGDDPQLRALLNDLELVLVQIIQLSGAPLDPADRALIERALEDRDLLPRIRTAVPPVMPGAASDD